MSSVSLKKSLLYERYFHWRAGEITRLEAFSDADLAFAVTLLVVSLEVPKTFDELALVMKGFVAFAICFAALALVWKEHTVFFRRYGLQTPFVVFLNCVLLFLILFYVYPLKFLFSFLVGEITHGKLASTHGEQPALLQSQVPSLMTMYGLGLAAVYLVFVLLYVYAYRRRDALELNEVEIYMTKHSIVDHGFIMSIGLLSTILAFILPVRISGLSGMIYWFIPIYFSINGSIMGSRTRSLGESLERRAAVDTATD
ncbi:MAG TPA: TMEM175 family protein [Terriglobales bacterium]|nr:TMEM175 family protein [Terriglobales bacterium]